MAQTERIRSVSDLTIVDADSHVTESLEDLMPYIPDRLRGVKRLIRTAKDARRDIYSATRATPAFSQTESALDGADAEDADLVHAQVQGPETKRKIMEKFGIDYSILTPGINLNLATVNHDPTAVALASAYNDWMVDTFLDSGPEGMKASLLVAHQKPSKAAEEIDRMAGEDDFVAVQLPASGLIPPAGHEWYDPIYEAAADHDLPVMMHSGNNGSSAVFPVQRQWAETFVEDHAFTFPVESMWHLISMVFRGVPEKHDVDVVMQEPGIEWLPWMLWRLDDHYLQNSQDVPILTKLPSEYIRDHFHFTSQPLGHTQNKKHLAQLIEMAHGSETLLFAVDHPHPDFDTPEELFTPLRMHMDDDDVRAIMGGTARELFGL